jgi:DNA-binding transcriptional ArsR family regulator
MYICAVAHYDVFDVLSDPTRRRIIDALRTGERSVNDIVLQVDIDQSGVSRHLGILREAGFVDTRPSGAQRLYSLRREPFIELDGWLSRYRQHATDRRVRRTGERPR